MKYRSHHNIEISEIGLGCYGLSGAYGTPDTKSYKKVIQRAYDMGVNFFDTAASYGDAEEILGEAIAPFRSDVIVSTKIVVGDGLKPNLSAKTIRQSCEGSLRALHTECIDLLQIHFDDPHTGVEETIGTLEALVMSGKIRWYGLGHLSPHKVNTYCDAGNMFSVMFELSAVARDARETILPKCREKGVAGLAFSVTGRGLLSGKYKPGYNFQNSDIRRIDPLFHRKRWESASRVQERLQQVGAKYGKSAIQIGIAWVLAQPGITCALTGPSSILHLAENVRVSEWKFPREELESLESFFRLEDARMRRELHADIQELLQLPLAEDRQQAFKDLVYILETAILLHLVDVGTIMPLFQDVFTLRNNNDESASVKMRETHATLREMITPKGV